jgi:hypothetical protein
MQRCAVTTACDPGSSPTKPDDLGRPALLLLNLGLFVVCFASATVVEIYGRRKAGIAAGIWVTILFGGPVAVGLLTHRWPKPLSKVSVERRRVWLFVAYGGFPTLVLGVGLITR